MLVAMEEKKSFAEVQPLGDVEAVAVPDPLAGENQKMGANNNEDHGNKISSAKLDAKPGPNFVVPSLLEVKGESNVSSGASGLTDAELEAAVNAAWTLLSGKLDGSSVLTEGIVKEYAANCLKGYNSVAYHDANHAYDVFKFVVEVFWDSALLPNTAKEAAALGALCHDFGHPGLNNKAMFKLAQADAAFMEAMNLPYAASDPGGLFQDTELNAGVFLMMRSPGKTAANIAPNAAGKAGGAFCAHLEEGPLIPPNCEPQCVNCGLPANWGGKCGNTEEGDACKPFTFFPGCGFSGGHCSSFEESYHADMAVQILTAAAANGGADVSEHLPLVKTYVEATDFGKDYELRTKALAAIHNREEGRDTDHELAGDIALHISDINAACKPNFLVWSCGVIAEFVRQGILGLSVGDSSLSPFPPTLQKLAEGQISWSWGIVAWFQTSFDLLKVGEDPSGHMTRLRSNIDAWKACAAAASTATAADGGPLLIIGTEDPLYSQFKQMLTDMDACGAAQRSKAANANAICDTMKASAQKLTKWTQLEIKSAMIAHAMKTCFSALPPATKSVYANPSLAWAGA